MLSVLPKINKVFWSQIFFLAVSPLQERVSVAGNVAGGGGCLGFFSDVCLLSIWCLKLAASLLYSLISPGMVLKRAGPDE